MAEKGDGGSRLFCAEQGLNGFACLSGGVMTAIDATVQIGH